MTTQRLTLLLSLLIALPSNSTSRAEESASKETSTKEWVTSDRWQVLFPIGRRSSASRTLTDRDPLKNLEDLQFTGPQPSHPFVLGNFASDGSWGIVNGGMQRISGHNAALHIAYADQFELEGRMDQTGYGGWFLLLGWTEGLGYAIHNVTMKQSGSPWFLSAFRGAKAIPEQTSEFLKHEWKREQPFRVVVRDNNLSMRVGKFDVLDEQPLENYVPGAIILGVYDTRYGPRPVRLTALRIRALTTK